MPDGLTIAAFALLVGLLWAWALDGRTTDRVANIEEHHARVKRLLTIVDAEDEKEYRHDLRVELELAEMLKGRSAA